MALTSLSLASSCCGRAQERNRRTMTGLLLPPPQPPAPRILAATAISLAWILRNSRWNEGYTLVRTEVSDGKKLMHTRYFSEFTYRLVLGFVMNTHS